MDPIKVTDVAFEGSKIIERRTQDVEPVLNDNKRLYTEADGYSKSRDLKRIASIPMVVIEQWRAEGVNIFDPNHADEIRRRLNSSDNRFLRTAPGVL